MIEAALAVTLALQGPASVGAESLLAFRSEAHAYADCLRASYLDQLQQRNERRTLFEDLRPENRVLLSQALIEVAERGCSSNIERMRAQMLEIHRTGGRQESDVELRALAERQVDEFVRGPARRISADELAEILARLDEDRNAQD